jgi:hypothetical protein
LTVLDQDYCQDSSNQSTEFTRNRLRHDLIPRLESDYNVQLIPALGRLALLADEVQQWLDQQTTELMAGCVELSDEGQEGTVVVDCHGLPAVRALLVRELFVAIWKLRAWPRQAMGFEKVGRIGAVGPRVDRRQRTSKTDSTRRLVRPADRATSDPPAEWGKKNVLEFPWLLNGTTRRYHNCNRSRFGVRTGATSCERASPRSGEAVKR